MATESSGAVDSPSSLPLFPEDGVPQGELPPLQGQPLPWGMVTFLYTDIEGSTRLWQEQPNGMPRALQRHDVLIRKAVEGAGGVIFRRMGDAVCAAFPAPGPALAAALAAQQALDAEPWEEGCVLRVRIGLHTGEAEVRAGDYVGHTLNRVARLLSAGHGGQILLSAATRDMVGSELPAGSELLDLGEHRLKDLTQPERIYQLRVPGLPNAFPALVTAGGQATNLPLQPTPFIGRGREMGEIIQLLKDPGVRLLTLTGPGGSGKTRLALEAARARLPFVQDGAFAVLLAPLADPALIPSAIAEALGLQEQGRQDLIERIVGYLEEKRLVLVLDNYEHLLEGAGVVSTLLHRCPQLQVLVTSRIPLHLTGEREYAVPPLSLPEPAYLPDLRNLSQYDALVFFVDRARAVKADFSLTDENAASVVAICQKLDGLPLAIELAAARIKVFPPAALVLQLERRLKLLTGGAKDRPARQKTLRGAIDWSYSLLSPDEQALFARLSIFAGGCTFDAAEAVCDLDGGLDLLEGIASLVDKSLLRQEGEEEPRFAMLETIREYAAEKLDERRASEAVRAAHSEYFLQLSKEAAPELAGPEQGRWLSRLDQELDNLRGALRWFLDRGAVEEALRLARALHLFWYPRGYYSEGQRWLEEALAAAGDGMPPDMRAKALFAAGHFAEAQGDWARAAPLLEEALGLFRQLGDGSGSAFALNMLDNTTYEQGQYERATSLFEETLRLGRELENGELSGSALSNLGWVAMEQGDLARAKNRFEEALAIFRVVGDMQSVAISLNMLGEVARHEGNLAEAEVRSGEGLALARELGSKRWLARCVANLGAVATNQGQLGRAYECLRESLLLSRELGDRRVTLESLCGMAALLVARGDVERATGLKGAETALRERLSMPLPPVYRAKSEETLAQARELLGEEGFTRTWELGRAMSLDEAVNYGLGDERQVHWDRS